MGDRATFDSRAQFTLVLTQAPEVEGGQVGTGRGYGPPENPRRTAAAAYLRGLSLFLLTRNATGLIVLSMNAARTAPRTIKFTHPTRMTRQQAMTRCAVGEATDADRVLLGSTSKDGRTMIGPDERQACDKHPGQFAVYRWTWDVPEDGDHARAIESSEPDIVQDCPMCAEEDDAKWREEIGDDA